MSSTATFQRGQGFFENYTLPIIQYPWEHFLPNFAQRIVG